MHNRRIAGRRLVRDGCPVVGSGRRRVHVRDHEQRAAAFRDRPAEVRDRGERARSQHAPIEARLSEPGAAGDCGRALAKVAAYGAVTLLSYSVLARLLGAPLGATRARLAMQRTGQARVVWTGDYESGDFSQWDRVLREDRRLGADRAPTPSPQGRYAARFVLGPQTRLTRARASRRTSRTSRRAEARTAPRPGTRGPSSCRGTRSSATTGASTTWFSGIPQVDCFGAALSVNGLPTPERLVFHVRGGDILRYGGPCRFRTSAPSTSGRFVEIAGFAFGCM